MRSRTVVGMTNTPEFKKAAIDWLLTVGHCEGRTSTGSALAALSVSGVDYDASEMPDFTRITTDPGDSFNEATYGEAFAARIYPNNSADRGKQSWARHDDFQFFVGDDDLKRIFLSQIIMGVLTAGDHGDVAWKARANPRAVATLTKIIKDDTERARLQTEALAARTEQEKG